MADRNNTLLKLLVCVLHFFGLLGLFMAAVDWIADKWDPPKAYKFKAKLVRDICRETSLQDYPVIFSEREACATCRTSTLMLVQPENICFECWHTLPDEARPTAA